MFKKPKLHSLLVIISLSVLAGLVAPAPTLAQEKDPFELNASLLKSAQDKTYRNIMRACLGVTVHSSTIGIGIEDITQGKWLYESTRKKSENVKILRAGYIVDPNDDGKLSCDGDNEWIISQYKALDSSYLEYTNGNSNFNEFAFICSIGFRPYESRAIRGDKAINNEMPLEDCANPNIHDVGTVVYRPVESKFPDNVTYDDAEKYVAYSYTFFRYCNPSIQSVPSDNAVTKDVVVVYADGTKETVTYHIPNGNHDVSVLAGEKFDCKDLPGEMEKTSVAYEEWLNDPANDKSTTTGAGDASNNPNGPPGASSRCSIEGIGWIVCPALGFIEKITGSAYNFIDRLLRIDVAIFDDKDDSLYTAWGYFRNIANVIFVVFFLIIIYSQMTGAGISNYGIKSLLPKLIISAVLVNVSFWICALAVDISNILGAYLKQFFDSLPYGAGSDTYSGWNVGNWAGTAIIGGTVLLAVTGVALAISIPVLLSAMLAVMVTLLILLLRQAIIIMLIVASPLAFVAYLLPNTEQWFKRWMGMFWSLLLLYPIIGVVFGASAFAANLIANVGAGDVGTTLESPDSKEMLQLVAIGIATTPLIVVPSLLRGALNATGELGAKMSGLSAKANKQIGSNVKNTSNLGIATRDAMAYRKRQGAIARSKRIAKYAGKNKFTRGVANVAGGKDYSKRMEAQAVDLEKKEIDEAIEQDMNLLQNNAKSPGDLNGMAKDQLDAAILSGDIIKARSAYRTLASNTAGRKMLNQSLVSATAEGNSSNQEVMTYLKGESLGSKGFDVARDSWGVSSGDGSYANQYTAGNFAKLNEQELGSQDDFVLENAEQAGAISQQQAADTLRANENGTVALTEKKKEILQRIQNGNAPPPIPPEPTTEEGRRIEREEHPQLTIQRQVANNRQANQDHFAAQATAPAAAPQTTPVTNATGQTLVTPGGQPLMGTGGTNNNQNNNP